MMGYVHEGLCLCCEGLYLGGVMSMMGYVCEGLCP